MLQVFPGAHISESARVHDALELVSALKFDLALVDLGLPDGSGVDVVTRLRDVQPDAQSVVVTIHDDDEHLFPALQAGAYGYILKEQPRELIIEQLQRISQGEPPLSPSIARRVMAHFSAQSKPQPAASNMPTISLTDRETEVLRAVAHGRSNAEIGAELFISYATVKTHVSRLLSKLQVRDRAQLVMLAYENGIVSPGSP